MKNSKSLPYIVAFVLFITICAAYFAPQFTGNVLRQHDVVQYEGMAQDIIEHRAQYNGEDPQWTGNMFSGMPAYLINMKHDGTILRTLSKAFYFMGEPAAFIFIAMTCFFCMLLCMGINPRIGIIPSLAYGLSTYFFIIIGAGHITKIMALAFAPMIMGGIFLAYRKNMWLGASLAGIFAAIQISVNHPQITYYFFFIILAFWISELIRSYKTKTLARFAKVTGLLALAGVLALGSNASMLHFINSHTDITIRGGSELASGVSDGGKKNMDLDYATAYSYGKGETLNLLIPNLYGGSSEGGFADDGEVADALSKYNARNMATSLPAYWGDQPITSGPVYIGAVALLLAVLGLFVLGGQTTVWISVITIIAIMLSWGKNMMWFTELFYNYIPLYDKFRTVSMILVIAEWSVPFLGALCLQKIWSGEVPKERFVKGLKYSTAIVGGLTLLILLFGGTIMSFTGAMDQQMPDEVVAAMRSERASMLSSDALRSLIFILLTSGVLWMFFNAKIKRWVFVCVLAALVACDMIPVNMRYMSQDRFVSAEKGKTLPTEADKLILQDTTLGYRVMNTSVSPFNDATTSYFHRSIGGYHGAKLARYQDIIERHLSKMNMNVYDMLNTKYFIVQDQNSGSLQVQQNPSANGAAWFVDSMIIVNGAEAEITALDSINTKTTAIIDSSSAKAAEGLNLSADSTARITMTEYRANMQQYKYNASKGGVAVFSEIYYPYGWSAYIDGVETPYFRADYILRAMVLPEGEHTVEFHFEAPDYKKFTTINLISSLLLLAAVTASIVIFFFKKHKQ